MTAAKDDAEKPKPKSTDPLDLNGRLYNQVGCLLDQLEKRDEDDGAIKITLKERIAALIAVGRIMTIFAGLRKREPDDPNAGAAVRRYAGAFKQDEAGGGKTGRRRRGAASRPAEPSPDPWFERTAAAGDDDERDDFDA